ncbi:MAG: isoprenyl transferase [Kordiimonadaceae bacterium]|nr:isoprenyl transferase [Kordiimonadaceae bacterium]MBO6570331.1 isoprenyl transferase [Kordiimonadaceae bacterium]MBO6965571.1 isoprenyl transferase [Kordiimonadaceae bacterium]
MSAEAAAVSTDTGGASAPSHVAIIMDGNGRWAQQHGVSRSKGHRKGADAVREAIEGAVENGVEFLTLYAFSTENWNRPEDEVRDLMGLLRMYLKKEVRTLAKEGVRLQVIGRRDALSDDIRQMIEDAERRTEHNRRLTLIIALSYGSREELTLAAQNLAQRVAAGEINASDIDEKTFSAALYTNKLPDPDLIIRTSGEQRLSNFLMWQAAYSEFLFLPTLWPDFTRQIFAEAVEEFKNRDRRYGARP